LINEFSLSVPVKHTNLASKRGTPFGLLNYVAIGYQAVQHTTWDWDWDWDWYWVRNWSG